MYFSCRVLLVVLAFCAPHFKCDTYDNHYDYRDVQGFESNNRQPKMHCADIEAEHSLNIEEMMGIWYGNEIIKHNQDVPGIYRYDSCVIINLEDATQQMQSMHDYNSYRRTPSTLTYQQQQQQHNRQQLPQQQQQQQQRLEQKYPQYLTKYLRLLWSEKDDNLEYIFNYTTVRPGLWMNVGEQRGSLVALNQYDQFSGSVQVVKAAPDHLVLTFCGTDVKNTMYSVVVSRHEEGLSREELRGIRTLLSQRGLSTETIRRVCSSSAQGIHASALLLMSMLIFFGIRKIC